MYILNFQYSAKCFEDSVGEEKISLQFSLVIGGGEMALILMFKVIQFWNDVLFRTWLKFFCRNSVIIGVLRCTEALKS